jgi:hypothetical protein
MPTAELTRLAVSEWSDRLADVTGEQVKQGLDMWREDWPPSADEFRKVCMGSQGALHNTAAYKPFVALPKPPRDKAVGVVALAAMRGVL